MLSLLFDRFKYFAIGLAIFAGAAAFNLVSKDRSGVDAASLEAKTQPGNLTARAAKDETVMVRKEDPDMNAARGKARATLDSFLAANASPAPGSRAYSIKVKVSDGEAVEHFWVKKFRRDGDGFAGAIDNAPEIVHTVRLGQEIRFARSEISDWMYIDNGKMKGNFTACALLMRETPAEREKFRKAYGLECGA